MACQALVLSEPKVAGGQHAFHAICPGPHWPLPPGLTSSLPDHACHTSGLPNGSSQVLTDAGCLCVSLPAADCVCPAPSTGEPLTAALAALATAERQSYLWRFLIGGRPDKYAELRKLISPGRLGYELFDQLRGLLAHHIHTVTLSAAQRDAVWCVLQHCCIFEDNTDGTVMSELYVAGSDQLHLAPTAAWETQSLRWGGLPNRQGGQIPYSQPSTAGLVGPLRHQISRSACFPIQQRVSIYCGQPPCCSGPPLFASPDRHAIASNLVEPGASCHPGWSHLATTCRDCGQLKQALASPLQQ